MCENTLIILDWDDTMFPTSWVTESKINIHSEEELERYKLIFTDLDQLLYKFLMNASELGKVIIITNASFGWINASSKLLPNTRVLLEKKITIHSARDMFKDSVKMEEWKTFAFQKEIKEYFTGNNGYHNIISIGDADYEFYALINLYDNPIDKITFSNRNLKTVRFINSPTLYSLIDQLTLLSSNIKKICEQNKHLDLKFESLKS